MLNHAGYLVQDNAPIPQVPLSVLSCGRYRLRQLPVFHTARPTGRSDYQLLYIAHGRAQFLLDKSRVWVSAGHVVLYRPHEPQEYTYYLQDEPDIYWIHFAGSETASLLQQMKLTETVCRVQPRSIYTELLEHIIREMQLQRPLAAEQTAALFRQLLIAFSRERLTGEGSALPRSTLVEQAVRYFHEHYPESVKLTEYVRTLNVELCWFSRLFRRQMGASPQQYLIDLRMTRAQELLLSTDYAVGEIARLVGYENPLYFSRLFARRTGCSPRDFRRKQDY